MNGMGSMPPYSYGEVSSAMKVFFLLVILFMAFLLIASSSLANVDLTPDTTALTDQTGSSAAQVAQSPSDVITIQDGTSASAQEVAQIPVTGPVTCTDPYIVRSGDMLSGIAALCNTTVAVIRTANPAITNADMIYPGQSLHIPGAAAAQPSTLQVNPQVQTLQVPVTGQTNPAPLLIAPNGAPVIQPGTGVQVKGLDFPANTPVYIAIGPQNTGYNIVASGVTDTNGNITTNIMVPAAPDANAAWVVVVATQHSPVVQAMSVPFYIAP